MKSYLFYYHYDGYIYGVIKVDKAQNRLRVVGLDFNGAPHFIEMNVFQERIEDGQIELTAIPPEINKI